MKQKLSITIEEDTLEKLGKYVSEGSFRNKSHVVEFALNLLVKQQNKTEEEGK